MEALGISIHQEPVEALGKLHRYGMAFLFAPDYHACMKHAAGVRKMLGFRSIFNMLGPLVNPGNVEHQVMGGLRCCSGQTDGRSINGIRR